MSVTDITGREPIPALPPAVIRKALRRKYGITQQELAKELHVSRQTIIAWERGSEPTGPVRAHYARILRAWKTGNEIERNTE